MTELCRLNMVFGPAHEDDVAAALIGHEPDLPGFTIIRAEGHSHDFAHASLRERVRGRIDRRVLWMVLPRAQVAAVLASVREHVSADAVVWWTEPVLEFGRLT